MKRIKEVNLIENQKLAKKLGYLSIPLILVFGVCFSWITLKIKGEIDFDFAIWELFLIVILYLIILVVHELIHGIFFKLFNFEGKVKFGFKNGMAYAASPNSVYSKGQFAWISLAPFTLITFALIFLLMGQVLTPFSFVSVATLHAISCVGDFYWIVLILQAPKNVVIEDTEQGINFYQLNT